MSGFEFMLIYCFSHITLQSNFKDSHNDLKALQ